MSIGAKIRLLLLILGMCCIATALSLKHSLTKTDFLIHEASELQENLVAKEMIVQDFLSSPEKLEIAETFDKNGNTALAFIETYQALGINLLIYKAGTLEFWSSAKVFPAINRIKEGTSFKQLVNGWYELIKKTSGDRTFLFMITVKSEYTIENQYLQNEISPELLDRQSLDLASFTDKETVDIFSSKKEYLFPVKLNESYKGDIYSTAKLWLWIIGLFSICLFVNSYCASLAVKGRAVAATLIIIIFFAALRLSDLQFLWLNHQFNLEIFKPSVYAQSDFLPSLGDFLLNVIAITWISLFAYTHRKKYRFPKWLIQNKLAGIIFHLILLLALSAMAFIIDNVFFGLIDNSKINFDITNIINLSFISMVCIFILCLVWFDVFLITTIFIELTKKLNVTHIERLVVFIGALSIYFVFKLIDDFNVYFLVYAGLIFILAWNNYVQHERFSIRVFGAIFFCMAFLTALKYIKFNDIKERSMRKGIAQKLMQADDPKVINSITSFEDSISGDSLIVHYFKKPLLNQSSQIHNYITKKYLDGYLSRFDYKMYEYNERDSAINHENIIPLSKYKSLVQSGAVKIQDANYFYRINDTFGFQDYFGIIPVFEKGNIIGAMVIELTSQPYDSNNHFPELLIDGKLNDEDFSNYSFAFYKDNKLFGQSGKYTYEMITQRFNGILDSVLFKNEVDPDYNHAIFRQDLSKVIVISKEKMPYMKRLATLSFFFLVFILFSAVLSGLIWLIKNIDDRKAGWFNINQYLLINANKILYKTRIQVTIVLAVVATLLIVGWTTFYYIKDEYLGQQRDAIREKVRKVQLGFEKMVLNKGLRNNDEAKYEFNQLADVNAAILNLYDVNGNLYLTSLQKIYDSHIIGPKIGAIAYINMHIKQKSEFLDPKESIGTFTYAAGYAPIRNAKNETIAYIGLPYYANEADYQEKIGLFINTLINIYALVFVLIGVLAVFLANQITHPLTFIQESIRQTKLGQRNHPLVWHRQDEIGLMIKEYNKMLMALELSAVKLARSERENAWREMAKQVAHEIKNPLTPLKLGVQLLEKSWKEQDPNFTEKFERFNQSFIEQIDSLATIASEFSNFAKMPDTKLEKLSLVPVIEQAIEVFNNIEQIEISLLNPLKTNIFVIGDKNQLLRAFNNLLKNAIEATEAKAKGIISIKITSDMRFAFVEVADNGKGIDESLQGKIFTPNFTTKSSGTGLGLAFVKQAIENAGGTIAFKSLPNAGTVFYLNFPLVESEI